MQNAKLFLQSRNPPVLDRPLASSSVPELRRHQQQRPLDRGVLHRRRQRVSMRPGGKGQGRGPAGARHTRRRAGRVLGEDDAHCASPVDLDLRGHDRRRPLDALTTVERLGPPKPDRGRAGGLLPLVRDVICVQLESLELVRHDALLALEQRRAVARRQQAPFEAHLSRPPVVAHGRAAPGRYRWMSSVGNIVSSCLGSVARAAHARSSVSSNGRSSSRPWLSRSRSMLSRKAT